jgi:hypothetical protein
MPLEIKRVKIVNRRDRLGCRNSTGSHVSSQRVHNLDVHEMRDMETDGRIADTGCDDVAGGCVQQQFHEG